MLKHTSLSLSLLTLVTIISPVSAVKNTSTIAFGTGGIRGKAHKHPFTTETLLQLGQTIGKWYKQQVTEKKHILIGGDTRASTTRIKQALATGLAREHIRVVDAGVVPTPAVVALINHDTRFDLGLVITASHNPAQDNGIKIVKKTGYITKDEEYALTTLFSELTTRTPLFAQEPNNINLVDESASLQKKYTEIIRSYFPALDLSKRTIVLDCAQGSTYQLAPSLLSSFGAHVITLGNNPDGYNINKECGSEHTDTIVRVVKAHRADIGFAFDGDGDRIIAINSEGIIKNGDDQLAILSKHPKLCHAHTVVGTIMTEHGLAQYFNTQNINLVRTPVGERNITNYLKALNVSLGGETSGHIVMPDYLPTSDSIFIALRLLECLINQDNWKMNSFTHSPQVLVNMPIKKRIDLGIGPQAMIIQKYQNSLPNGRIVVRFSGTENLLRILVEDQNETNAQSIAKKLELELAPLVNGLPTT